MVSEEEAKAPHRFCVQLAIVTIFGIITTFISFLKSTIYLISSVVIHLGTSYPLLWLFRIRNTLLAGEYYKEYGPMSWLREPTLKEVVEKLHSFGVGYKAIYFRVALIF